MPTRCLIKDYPRRTIALTTGNHILTFRHSQAPSENNGLRSASQSSLGTTNGASGAPKCMVEFTEVDEEELSEYRPLSSLAVHGTLGLITVEDNVFLCVVSAANKVATIRPGESVLRISSVEFHCLSSSSYDHLLNDEINPYPTDTVDEEGFSHDYGSGRPQGGFEHPCLALKKLLSTGTFYYSADFDLTRRLQDRFSDANTIALDSIDAGFLWNSYMIRPLVDFRSRLSEHERSALDASKILTSAIRGFCLTMPVPASSSPIRTAKTGLPASLTLVSRLSCRRAGTRFNSRGIDDDGNVANFVETETVFWTPAGICFSYAQVRGSVPLFWEQTTGLLPNQQKINLTRSVEAAQPAFDKHFEDLENSYGPIHVVNLLSNDKPGELDLTRRYRQHASRSSLNHQGRERGGHELLKQTDYDFHAETKGPAGYEAASMIKRYIQDSADSFAYFLLEDVAEHARSEKGQDRVFQRAAVVLQQEGTFRTNCLDCLDRTNLVQTIISKMALEAFLEHRAERGNHDFFVRHSSLWADNGDALSRIYAGTGALKSSFTRHGKMSLAGALADARKSATRMYINNFADKGRQITIDTLLGRQMGQMPVHLYDPINDYVQAELSRRAGEYSSTSTIHILAGTFNLNGRMQGLREDLSPWLCPAVDLPQQNPEIVAVGFQEIVELSPQQIMSTDPARRQQWEEAVKKTLNENAQMHSSEEYVILRGGQLVGASLSIFVKASVLKYIKNVEGSLKKTGLSGIAGNKGAVAIRMDYANTSFCFVTAHLAAGFANYEERNRDYRTIAQGLHFQRNRTIDDHDAVIWLGDFNYRIGLQNDAVRALNKAGDAETLYENDQLNIQMQQGLTFPYYAESRISFAPTYKYDNGTDTYDSSEKQRIPAWCDRILRKGDNLRQLSYATAPLRFSDHRPVYATFAARVSVIDESTRDSLSRALYAQRRSNVNPTGAGRAPYAQSIASDLLDDQTTSAADDDEDLLGYESIEPGLLPPASSSKRKWWLDNGQPARSTVKPPKGTQLNPNRPSNPWRDTGEADWVAVEKPAVPAPRRSAATGVGKPERVGPGFDGTIDGARRPQPPPPSVQVQEKRALPPPLVPTRAGDNVARTSSSTPSSTPSSYATPVDTMPPNLPTRTNTNSSRGTPSTYSLPARSPSVTSTSTSISRKAAPPVPKKPNALTNSPTPSIASPPIGSSPSLGTTSPSSNIAAFANQPPSVNKPVVPLPRRGGPGSVTRKTVGPGDADGDEAPALPPRRTGTDLSMKSTSSFANAPGGGARGGYSSGGRGLLDVDDDEGEKLQGWEVLRPG